MLDKRESVWYYMQALRGEEPGESPEEEKIEKKMKKVLDKVRLLW